MQDRRSALQPEVESPGAHFQSRKRKLFQDIRQATAWNLTFLQSSETSKNFKFWSLDYVHKYFLMTSLIMLGQKKTRRKVQQISVSF